MQTISFQPLSVMTDGGAREGHLAFADGHLVGVFVRVSSEDTVGGEIEREGWFLEAGFGPCSTLVAVMPGVFATLEKASDWMRAKLAARA